MHTVLLWGGLIAIGTMAVIAFRYFSIRRITLNRTPIDLQEIHRTVADKASFDTVKQVFQALGDAYSVDPGLIRPEDPLKYFSNADSWRLDAGTEQLNKWLQSIGIKEIGAQPKTVLDLLVLVETRHKPS
jgi:hypothetical protein